MSKYHARIGLEVAEASRATTGKQRRSFPNELVQTARHIEKLMGKGRRKLKKELRHIETDIKHEKRMLKALAGAEEGDL